jgi:hypothetical protein
MLLELIILALAIRATSFRAEEKGAQLRKLRA